MSTERIATSKSFPAFLLAGALYKCVFVCLAAVPDGQSRKLRFHLCDRREAASSQSEF